MAETVEESMVKGLTVLDQVYAFMGAKEEAEEALKTSAVKLQVDLEVNIENAIANAVSLRSRDQAGKEAEVVSGEGVAVLEEFLPRDTITKFALACALTEPGTSKEQVVRQADAIWKHDIGSSHIGKRINFFANDYTDWSSEGPAHLQGDKKEERGRRVASIRDNNTSVSGTIKDISLMGRGAIQLDPATYSWGGIYDEPLSSAVIEGLFQPHVNIYLPAGVDQWVPTVNIVELPTEEEIAEQQTIERRASMLNFVSRLLRRN